MDIKTVLQQSREREAWQRLIRENHELRAHVIRLRADKQRLEKTVAEFARRLKTVKDAWARLPESATNGIRPAQW